MNTVKIDIIAGFLGAGKTTLINKLLDEAYIGEKIAILENEFGAVGIDGELINKSGIQITEITNGCICCSLRGALEEGLATICRDFAPDRILIEPTGLADAQDIATPIETVAKEYPLAIEKIIAVVSAVQYEALLNTIGPFIQNQIEHAGLVVLSRVEEANGAAVAAEIKKNHPNVPVIARPWSKISGLTILEAAKPYQADDDHDDHNHCGCHAHHHHDHHATAADYAYYCGTTNHVFTEAEVALLEQLFQGDEGGDICRAKGILKGINGGYRFDYVGDRFALTPFPVGGEGKFTVIGKNIDSSFWEKTIAKK